MEHQDNKCSKNAEDFRIEEIVLCLSVDVELVIDIKSVGTANADVSGYL